MEIVNCFKEIDEYLSSFDLLCICNYICEELEDGDFLVFTEDANSLLNEVISKLPDLFCEKLAYAYGFSGDEKPSVFHRIYAKAIVKLIGSELKPLLIDQNELEKELLDSINSVQINVKGV